MLYRDRETLQPEEFYRRLETEKELPTTAQASVSDYAQAYRAAQERGAKLLVLVVNGN
jgi:fatty acid-binding protein DegV